MIPYRCSALCPTAVGMVAWTYSPFVRQGPNRRVALDVNACFFCDRTVVAPRFRVLFPCHERGECEGFVCADCAPVVACELKLYEIPYSTLSPFLGIR